VLRSLSIEMELFGEKFGRRFDRAASQKPVGRWRSQRQPANQRSDPLNERGPVLNVFWSRGRGMGAQVNRKKDQDKDGEAYRWKQKKSLPRSGARPRWVTERIASAQAMARR